MEPLKKTPKDDNNIRVAIVGNVDSGKSTLVGVLTKGLLDDGRGAARKKVFNYPHEAETGRTSSIAQEIMGFDEKGKQVFAKKFVQSKNKYWAEVMENSAKVISLIDLCGHEKYLKTTLLGLMGIPPDYVIVVIGANAGVAKMTKEHLGIATSLDLPLIIVVTKVDMVLPEVTKKTLDEIKEIFNQHKFKKKILQIEYDEEDVKTNEKDALANAIQVEATEDKPIAKHRTILNKEGLNKKEEDSLKSALELISTDRVCPLFLVSSVTNFGMLNLTSFLYRLTSRVSKVKHFSDEKAPVEFDVHEHLNPVGVGHVVSGLLKSGTVKVNSQLCLGPDEDNTFKSVIVKSIHFNRVPAEEAYAGQFCCFAIRSAKKAKELEKKDFRKGIVLVDPLLNPKGSFGFEAKISVLHHATTINKGYECVMHLGVVRQTVKLLNINDKQELITGDKSVCIFKFLFCPEFIKPGMTFMLREGRTKVVGEIVKIYDDLKELSKFYVEEEPKLHDKNEEIHKKTNERKDSEPKQKSEETNPKNQKEQAEDSKKEEKGEGKKKKEHHGEKSDEKDRPKKQDKEKMKNADGDANLQKEKTKPAKEPKIDKPKDGGKK